MSTIHLTSTRTNIIDISRTSFCRGSLAQRVVPLARDMAAPWVQAQGGLQHAGTKLHRKDLTGLPAI